MSNNAMLLSFPLYFKWTITSECNLRCKHCFLSSYTTRPDLEKIKKSIVELSNKNISCICFTGGEPLLRNDLEEIIQTATEKKIMTSIATNGTLLTKERIKTLNESGVFEYQISLDGANEETNDLIRGKGTFKKAIDAIRNLKELNARVILAMTLNKTNYNQIEEIVSLAEALGVDLIRFEIFIPLGNGKLNSNSLQLEDYQLEYIRDKSFNYRSDSVKIQYPIFNSKYGCGAGFISCIVNDDFTLSPCDMLASDVKTEPFRDIKHFEELWKCSKVFNKWRDLSVVDEYCEKCSHVDKCNYGCRAVSQAFEGNLNSADKLCMYREKD